jgi:hypothetical protein
MIKANFLISLTVSLFAAYAASAQAGETPDELIAIYKCKSIEKPEIRLECYDNAVERFKKADNDGDLVTVSKSKIQNVEREAFGFNIPSLSSINRIFGLKEKSESDTIAADIKDKNQLTAPVKKPSTSKKPPKKKEKKQKIKVKSIDEVVLNIKKTSVFGYKKTRFFMTNGQVWEQIDNIRVRIPRAKDNKVNTALISKGAIGSFLLRINSQGVAIRVRRVR